MDTVASPRPRDGVLRIRGHMAAAEQPPPVDAIRIDSNESVYGPSPAAREAAIQAVEQVERYPLDASATLAGAIGRRFALDPARICCGFGSDDLLARLARIYLGPGDELVYPVHGYQKIPNYAHANDAIPVAADDRDFTADVDAILARVTERTRMVMLANPDNPTGTYVSGSEVRRLHAGLRADILLVLDSAYLEYVVADDYEAPDRMVEQHDNVVMTRTFSKVFGMAGMRIGWLYGPPSTVDLVQRIGITFPLTTPGLAAALAALADTAHTDEVVARNAGVREWFSRELEGLGATVFPSQSNFVLARFAGGVDEAMDIQHWLESNHIIPRRLASADFADCIRFTLGSAEEMRKVIECMARRGQ